MTSSFLGLDWGLAQDMSLQRWTNTWLQQEAVVRPAGSLVTGVTLILPSDLLAPLQLGSHVRLLGPLPRLCTSGRDPQPPLLPRGSLTGLGWPQWAGEWGCGWALRSTHSAC